MRSEMADLAFRSILTFVQELNGLFGEASRPLQRYAYLLSKTTFSDIAIIEKHQAIFTRFCMLNRIPFQHVAVQSLEYPRIEYSDKAFIDIGDILARASSKASATIWKHLLTISAILDPDNNAKQLLLQLQLQPSIPATTNADGISKILDDIKNHPSIQDIDPDASPEEMLKNLMQSPILPEIFSKTKTLIENGQLDLSMFMPH